MGGVANSVCDFFSDAVDFVGDTFSEGWKDIESLGRRSVDYLESWKNPMEGMRRTIGGLGEGVLAIPKWAGDIAERTGKITGIEAIENYGDTLGDIARDKRLEGLAGSVAAAYAAPFVVAPLADSLSTAAWGAGEAAAVGDELTTAQWLVSHMPNGMFNYIQDVAAADPLMSAGKELLKGGLKLGAQEGLKEFVLEPALEKYMEKMKALQALSGQQINLRDYGPTTNKFTVDPSLLTSNGLMQMPSGTVTGLPDVGPGNILTNTDYLKDIQDYAKLPDLWNYLKQGG